MGHKELCRQLKKIRKNLADQLGIDLHQTECTYPGECSGTCPKCQKEENILSKALLSGAIAITAASLSACGTELSGDVVDTPSSVVQPLGGDMAYEPAVDDNLDVIPGDDDAFCLSGDIAFPSPYEIPNDDYDTAPIPEDVVYEVIKECSGAAFCKYVRMNDAEVAIFNCYKAPSDDVTNESQFEIFEVIYVNLYTGEVMPENGTPYNIIEHKEWLNIQETDAEEDSVSSQSTDTE